MFELNIFMWPESIIIGFTYFFNQNANVEAGILNSYAKTKEISHKEDNFYYGEQI